MALSRHVLLASLLAASCARCTPAGSAPTAQTPPAPPPPPTPPPPPPPVRYCPEAVRPNARGEPVGVSSGHLRWCFPGELHCHCDADDDCYAEAGYVACTPPPGTSSPDASADVAAPPPPPPPSPPPPPPPPSDASLSPPPADTVAYSGTFASAPGLQHARLTVLGASRDVWVYAPASRGASPPLLLAFHGTNGDGQGVIDESGARALADAEGVVVVAPTSRWFDERGADYDHPQGNGTYWETNSADINTNADLVLVRAALVEAQRRYNTDPNRVYAIGHSNGGFMSLLVSVALRDRVAAFAENSAGMVTCASRPQCSFQGSALTCADLARQPGWCNCNAASHPIAIPTSGRRAPGYLSHGAQDPMVSVYYSCALASRLAAAGVPSQTYLWEGEHYLAATFARRAWSFMSSYRRQ
ncbi:MAG: alpha/beta hydrolase-fold protein [Polyangiales bacterium]